MTDRAFSGGLAVLFAAVVCVTAAAQEQRPLPPSIRTTGEAVIALQPDRAQIDIGVTTQALTAQAAATQNAKQLDAVLADLRKALGQPATMKTVSYSLHPDMRYPREGGRPTITGYTAANVINVTLDRIEDVGKAIDAATKTGANTIHRLQFTLKDEQAAQSQALREAAARARTKAEALAAALGVRIIRVLSASEAEAQVIRPMRDGMMAARAGAVESVPTPVEPGKVEIRGTVTLTVEVAP